MKFGPVPLDEAHGKVLGHNVTGPDGRRIFRKGKALENDDVELLKALGRKTVYVAELAADDIDENSAALRIAQELYDANFRLSGPSTGRVNIYTLEQGIVRVDVNRLFEINQCDGVTLATLRHNTPVVAGKVAGTLKVLPYALPLHTVRSAEQIVGRGGALLRMDRLQPRRVTLILSGSPLAQDRIMKSFESALEQRLSALGSAIHSVDFIPLDEEEDEAQLGETISRRIQEGTDLIIMAGETAIMDRHDIAPRAVERAGGRVISFGAPVDPGNLLMLAEVEQVPIMGAPGCARSPKDNIVDLILPRLLVGDRLDRSDIIALAHGGLLEDVPERPSPRSRLS